MSGPLLVTKLYIPPSRPDLVARPHLIKQLDQAMSGPHNLFLLSAPAGFGKTTLVAEWLWQSNQPAAWLSLDQDDNDPAHFWHYVIAALQTKDKSLGRAMQVALQAALQSTLIQSAGPQIPALKPLLTSLINDLAARSHSLILVLDDYHLINNDIIHDSLNFFLDHLPPQIRLVIATRADPPLALSRRRGLAQILETRTADLRFSLAEASTFLNAVNNLDMSAEDVHILEQRTEGWIVGLQLAALSLRQQADRHAFVTAFAGDDRYIVDYLLEEVLQQQPALIQTFLLQTSILDRMCGPLCEAVTRIEHAETLLHQLEQANLFIVPLDNRRIWYRYHHLFANLLYRRLCQAEPLETRLALVQRACNWHEREGFITEAISLALDAPDFELAANLLERHILTMFFRSETMLVYRWLQALPEHVVRERALLCAVYANTIAHAGQGLLLTEQWLNRAIEIAPPASQPYDIVHSFIALSRAYLALWRRDPPQQIIDLALAALATLPPPEEPGVDPNFLRLRSGLTNNLGLAYLIMGNEDAAIEAFIQARQIGTACDDLLNAYSAVEYQCFLLRRRGRLVEAAALCQEILHELGEDPFPYAGRVCLALSHILLEWNNLEAAEKILNKGLWLSQMALVAEADIYGQIGLAYLRQAQGEPVTLEIPADLEPQISTYAMAHRVRLWLMQGKLDAAIQWAEGRSFDPKKDWIEIALLTRVLLAQQRAAEIDLSCLAQMSEWFEGKGWIEIVIEAWMLRALTLHMQGHFDKARRALEQSLVLAEPGGYVRLFVNEGDLMRDLLQISDDERITAYVERLLTFWEQPVLRSPELWIEPLSQRELEVLRLLAAGASNAEIAEKLVVTVNTAKKHVAHILEKLDVPSRARAAIRARELRLLD